MATGCFAKGWWHEASPEMREEHREKIRATNLARWAAASPETREKWVKAMYAGRARNNFSYRHTPEYCVTRAAGIRRETHNPKTPKLTDKQVNMIRDLLDSGWRVGDLAEEFGVSSTIISYIKSRKTYRWVEETV